MEREALFTTLSVAFFAVVVLALAAGLPRGSSHRDPPPEPRAWWALLRPLLGGLLTLAFLLGWVLQEPDPADEWASPPLVLLAVGALSIVVRAIWRAARSLAAASATSFPIATVGLFRTRYVLSEPYLRMAAPDTLSAALEHESAHARHRDPLRIWLSQIAADLQWPVPGARRRFHTWLLALELHRDEEAVGAGASPVELAEALLLAAQLGCPPSDLGCTAPLLRGPEDLELRVHRLLELGTALRPAREQQAPKHIGGALLMLVLALELLWLGWRHGEEILRMLPGVWT